VTVRPGTSDRQLGTAVLLVGASAGYALDARFEASPEAGWLQAHAHEFGFALADPSTDDVALRPVPWHHRYIGREEATRWLASGEPLSRYLLALR
jgi:zinc D-Ala-D-Ala carboxypeptidase